MRIGRCLRNDTPDAWLELDLTIAQLKSLMFISHEGVTNSKTLAAALGVSPPNATGIVDRMVEQGLLSREYNPQNRRTQVLKVTEKGHGILNQLREGRTARFTSVLMLLNEEDLAVLARGLNALAVAAERNLEKEIGGYSSF